MYCRQPVESPSSFVSYVDGIRAESHDGWVTVVLPEFVPQHWWHHVLHNQHALMIKGALLFKPDIVVTSVPFHIVKAAPARS